MLGRGEDLAGRLCAGTKLGQGLDRRRGCALSLLQMPATLFRSGAQSGHVFVDQPNLPAERVDAVAPALALELPLLQRGALRCHLPYAGLQLPTHPGRSLFGGARRALQAGQLQLLGLFGGARRLEHARHLFGPRGSGGLRAELREARLRGVQDPSCLGRIPRLRLDGGDPPQQLGAPCVERDSGVCTRPDQPSCSVDASGGDVAPDDHAAQQSTRDALVAGPHFHEVVQGSFVGFGRVFWVQRGELLAGAGDRPHGRLFIGGDDRVDQRPEHRGQRRLGSRPGGDHVTQPETMPRGRSCRIDAAELGLEPGQGHDRLLCLLCPFLGERRRRLDIRQRGGGGDSSGSLHRLLLEELAPGSQGGDR